MTFISILKSPRSLGPYYQSIVLDVYPIFIDLVQKSELHYTIKILKLRLTYGNTSYNTNGFRLQYPSSFSSSINMATHTFLASIISNALLTNLLSSLETALILDLA